MKRIKDLLRSIRSKIFYSRLFYDDRITLIVETELENIDKN